MKKNQERKDRKQTEGEGMADYGEDLKGKEGENVEDEEETRIQKRRRKQKKREKQQVK